MSTSAAIPASLQRYLHKPRCSDSSALPSKASLQRFQQAFSVTFKSRGAAIPASLQRYLQKPRCSDSSKPSMLCGTPRFLNLLQSMLQWRVCCCQQASLTDMGLWNLELKNEMILHNGSIQKIDKLLEELRTMFPHTSRVSLASSPLSRLPSSKASLPRLVQLNSAQLISSRGKSGMI
ncbi:hypothetical protein L7F22_011339 [Adiantum nelumboides]|nr:hypothetical protein [Adiantum nelumboides]